MADILDSYQEFKIALREISKQIYELFEKNDVLGVLKTRGVSRLEIVENKHNPAMVDLEFFSFKEDILLFTFTIDRSTALEFDEIKLIDVWFTEIISMIEKTNIMTAKKFMKAFPKSDYPLIMAICHNIKTFKDKTDDEIAVLVSKHITGLLEKHIEEKRNENIK